MGSWTPVGLSLAVLAALKMHCQLGLFETALAEVLPAQTLPDSDLINQKGSPPPGG